MSVLRRIVNALSGGGGTGGAGLYPVRVKCNRCGEILTARVNLANDLSVEFDPSGSPQSYSCRKSFRAAAAVFKRSKSFCISIHIGP